MAQQLCVGISGGGLPVQLLIEELFNPGTYRESQEELSIAAQPGKKKCLDLYVYLHLPLIKKPDIYISKKNTLKCS